MEGRDIGHVAAEMVHARCCIALTGAGISTESGIPDFRSADGLWSRYDIYEYGHIKSFRSHPEKVWRMLAEMASTVSTAQPNEAHRALAQLECTGVVKALITQNVDALHKKAGSRTVIEFHGTMEKVVCLGCGKEYASENISLENLPPHCSCGGILKPDVVLIGEPIRREVLSSAFRWAATCDMMLVVGTSCEMMPAAELPHMARRNGAVIVEINREETALSPHATYTIKGNAGEVLGKILDEVTRLLQAFQPPSAGAESGPPLRGGKAHPPF